MIAPVSIGEELGRGSARRSTEGLAGENVGVNMPVDLLEIPAMMLRAIPEIYGSTDEVKLFTVGRLPF